MDKYLSEYNHYFIFETLLGNLGTVLMFQGKNETREPSPFFGIRQVLPTI
jgi:hypothetical protein